MRLIRTQVKVICTTQTLSPSDVSKSVTSKQTAGDDELIIRTFGSLLMFLFTCWTCKCARSSERKTHLEVWWLLNSWNCEGWTEQSLLLQDEASSCRSCSCHEFISFPSHTTCGRFSCQRLHHLVLRRRDKPNTESGFVKQDIGAEDAGERLQTVRQTAWKLWC